MARYEAQGQERHPMEGDVVMTLDLWILCEVQAVVEASLLEARQQVKYAPIIWPIGKAPGVQHFVGPVAPLLFAIY